MKLQIAIALGLLWASSPYSHAQEVAPGVAAPAPLSAAQILEKSRQTYAAFSSYKGSCSIVSDSVIAQGDDAPMQNVSVASAQIEFERGQRLSVEGVDMGGQGYRALWTPAQTWLEMARGRQTKEDAGKVEREIIKSDGVLSARDALFASLSGVTLGTGSNIPNALMPDQFDLGNPFTLLGTAKLLPARGLGNVPCYVIEATAPELNRVTTYWIEQKTFLLRRLTEELGEQRFDDLPLIDGKPLPIMRIAYSYSQFVFATTEAK